MSRTASVRVALAVVFVLSLIGGVVTVNGSAKAGRTHVTAYFANSNGIFPGDDVVILGVRVGEIDTIEPLPGRAKISFWFDDTYQVPADVKAVILSPQLITSRAIQLTPVYTGGPVLRTGEVIPLARTAVPVEWDDFRQQLERLAHMLQPTQPGGASPLGEFINTAADNLRGQGMNIRDSIIELSQVFSTLGDHSQDIFSTVRNLATLVSALQSSTVLMRELNLNLASVTALLANEGNELGQMFVDVDNVAGAVDSFVADNREALGTTSDRLTSISQAVADSIDDVKQTLHVGPTAFQNFVNIYEPAHASLTGALAINNFSDPITFLCGAIQAASRLRAEQAAKLCVQYLAPIVKNRQYNFPPIGLNPFVNAQARPNEVTYSEDWLRPGYPPSPPPAPGPPSPAEMPTTVGDAAAATDPADGLPGLMVVPGGGS